MAAAGACVDEHPAPAHDLIVGLAQVRPEGADQIHMRPRRKPFAEHDRLVVKIFPQLDLLAAVVEELQIDARLVVAVRDIADVRIDLEPRPGQVPGVARTDVDGEVFPELPVVEIVIHRLLPGGLS